MMLLPLNAMPGSLSLPPCTQPRVGARKPEAKAAAFSRDRLTLQLCRSGPQRALWQHTPEALVFSDPAAHSFGELNQQNV